MKQKFFTGLAILAAIILISGAGILATASPGTTSDPLITLTYLNGPFRTLIDGDIRAARTSLQNDVNARANALERLVNNDLTNAQNNTANVFRSVSVTSATPLVLGPGSEFILRTGDASYTTAGGNLVKYTGTPSEASSGSLVINNMYLSSGTTTISTEGGARLFVRTVEGTLPIGFTFDDLDMPECPDCGFIFCMCIDFCGICFTDPCVCEDESEDLCDVCEINSCVCE